MLMLLCPCRRCDEEGRNLIRKRVSCPVEASLLLSHNVTACTPVGTCLLMQSSGEAPSCAIGSTTRAEDLTAGAAADKAGSEVSKRATGDTC